MTSRPALTALLAALVVPAIAFAGKTVTDGTDTLKIGGTVDPAKASKPGSPRAVELSFDYVAGTTDGSRVPDVRSASVSTDGRTNYDAFPKCSEVKLRANGARACPKGSRVGKGTAIAEIHIPGEPESKENATVSIRIFNGKVQTDRNARRYDKPRDGLVFFGRFEGANLAIPFEAEDGNRRLTYYNPKRDPNPPGDNALYTVKEVHVTFPRRTRRGVPWMQAPTKCPRNRKWVVTATMDRYDGGKLTARHAVSCTPA